jgi:hypothetical protein
MRALPLEPFEDAVKGKKKKARKKKLAQGIIIFFLLFCANLIAKITVIH